MLTLQKLKDMKPGEIIAQGTTTNSPEGVYMTDSNKGKELLWVAKRGQIHDWAIYIHWAEKGLQYVIEQGDKVMSKDYIEKLVPCEPKAFDMYRY